MQSFEFYAPTRILFGPDTELQAGSQIRSQGGSRVLLVCGGKSAAASGLLARVEQSLKDAGLEVQTLSGVRPNPRLSLAREGVKQALALGADFILALGGGSVIDTAKAIADGAANPDVDLWRFWLREVPLTRSLPVGVILTIPAAGSECSDSAVLTNEETHEKRGFGSDLHRPRFAILNPALTATLPPYQVACGVVDIMMHTMDRYFNPFTDNNLTDELAEGLLRATIQNGRLALEQPGSLHAMGELMWAGSLSHNGLTGLGGAKDFAPHQLGHELSAMFDATHGATLSAVWGNWARYCLDTNPARFARFGERVWGLSPAGKTPEQAALEAIEATEHFFRTLNMPTCLPELGCGVLDEGTLKTLAYRCTYYHTRTIGTFRVLDEADILAIYRLANHEAPTHKKTTA